MTKSTFSLQDALAELQKIEQYFQQPNFDLDEGVKQHAKAVELAKKIEAYLSTIEHHLTTVEGSEVLAAEPSLDEGTFEG